MIDSSLIRSSVFSLPCFRLAWDQAAVMDYVVHSSSRPSSMVWAFCFFDCKVMSLVCMQLVLLLAVVGQVGAGARSFPL